MQYESHPVAVPAPAGSFFSKAQRAAPSARASSSSIVGWPWTCCRVPPASGMRISDWQSSVAAMWKAADLANGATVSLLRAAEAHTLPGVDPTEAQIKDD